MKDQAALDWRSNARHHCLSGKVLAALVLGVLCRSAALAQSSVPAGTFPRVGNVWWGANLYTANPSEASQVQLFLGPQFTAAQASALHTADPNGLMLVAMNLMETTAGVPSVPSSYYLLDTNGNKICDWPGNPPNYILNMTNPAVAQFVGQYAAEVLSQSGTPYSGVFFDNLISSIANKTSDCYGNPIQISSQGNGVADNPAILNAAWAAGLYTALSAFKSQAPGAYAIVHANQLPPDARSLGLLNGDAFVFDIPNIREGTLAFGNLWDSYHQWFENGQEPVLAAVQSSPPNQIANGYGYTPGSNALPQTVTFGQTFYPNMRFGLAFAMMDDGFFIHDFGDNSSPVTWWYDEYNFNMGLPVAPYELIGSDSGPNQLVDASFEGGLSPWQFSTSGSATGTATIDSSTAVDGSVSAHVDVTSASTLAYQVDLEQDHLSFAAGTEYQVDFWAKSDVYFPLHIVTQGGAPSYANYGLSTTITIGPNWNPYTVSFIANSTASDGRLEFQFGCLPGNVWIDNVKLIAAPSRFYRRDFQNGVVLLNGTNTPQTVPLEYGLRRLNGSQAPRYQYIVDDNSSSFTGSGSWVVNTFDTGWRKSSGPYFHAWNTTLHELDTSTGSGTWSLNIPADGQYTLQAWLPAAPTADTWTKSAVYQVMQGGSVLGTLTLDQSAAGQGDQWFNLGTFNLIAAQIPILQIQNGGSGPLIADAIYIFSTIDRYNDGSPVSQVTIQPMDGILLQRQTPNQAISFVTPGNQIVGTSLTLTATASSGLIVIYSSNTTGICQINGNAASFLSTGTCSITARQPGDSRYTAAVPVTQAFSVLESQAITLSTPGTQILGTAPFAIAAASSSGLTVTLNSTTTPVCTVSGSLVTLVGAGTCTVAASQSGNATYAPAPSVTVSFAVLLPQTINFGPLSLAAIGGLPFQVSATADSGLVVLFTSAAREVCAVSGTMVSLLKPGTCFIVASQPGDALHAAAAPVTQSFTVVPNLLTNGGFEGTSAPWLFSVAAGGQYKATAALDTSQFVDGKSSIDVNTLQIGPAAYSIDLEQGPLSLAGGATYGVQFWAKSDSPHTIQVEIQGGGPAYPIYGLYQNVKIGSNWTRYSYSFIASATVSDARLEFHFGTSTGNVWIDDVQLFGTASVPQTITFPAVANMIYGSAPVTLLATSTSWLPVSYGSNSATVCSITGSQVYAIGVGACSITALQPGNSTYQPANPVTQTFLISAAPQTISFAPLGNTTYGTAPLTIAATASSGLQVSFASTTTGVCTVAGLTVSIVGAGSCSITASQGGNADYTAAPSVSQSFTVAALAQTISFPAVATQGLGGIPLVISASASSGLPVAITSSTPGVCAVSGNAVSLLMQGECTLTAMQAGSTGYAPANPVSQSFAVVPNLLGNGAFDIGALTPWNLFVTADESASATAAVDTTTSMSAPSSMLINVTSIATANWHVDLEQGKMPILAGKRYMVQFWAKSGGGRSIQVVTQGGSPGFANYGLSTLASLGTTWTQYTFSFTATSTASDCRLEFYFGSYSGSVWLDNVQFFAAN